MSSAVKSVALFTHHVPEVSAEVLGVVVPILLSSGIRLLLPPGKS